MWGRRRHAPYTRRRQRHYDARDIFEDPPTHVEDPLNIVDAPRSHAEDVPEARAEIEEWISGNVPEPLDSWGIPLEPPNAPRRRRVGLHRPTTH